MATRQRARSSTKAPVNPVQSTTDGDISPSAAVPEADSAAALDSRSEPPLQIRFVGEQVVYKSREERIAESAYLYAEARGFHPGYELEDWLKAEKDVDALLSGGAGLQAD